jgi:PBP1b-binding outer membrane lipoprotein LpoB
MEKTGNTHIRDQNRIKSCIALVIVIIIVILAIILSGCSREATFQSYKQVSDYCYNKTISIENCSLEKCIMLNSAEFTDQIKFSAEKNYLQCQLQHCK